MPARKKSSAPKDSTAHISFEAKLWIVDDSRSLSAAKGNRGDISIYGQEKRAWGARFGRAKRARRVRLRRKQPNQSNPTTRRHLQQRPAPDLRAYLVPANDLRGSPRAHRSLATLMERSPLLPFSRNKQ